MSAGTDPTDSAPSIVYVDDDGDLLKLAKLCFNVFGDTDIETCEDVNDFMRMFEKGRFSVMLFDWQMPDMTGIELAEWVRRVQGDIDSTVILVTARDVDKEAGAIEKLHIAGVIAKPFEPDALPSLTFAMHRK